MFPKSTHETFAQKMYQTYKGHKRFSKPKLARTDFTINHYAGDVCETIRNVCINLSAKELCSSQCFGQTGNLPSRSLPGQKQGLCCCRTSSSLDCLSMLVCCESLPSVT